MQCAQCSTPVPDAAKYCHNCGSLVSDAEGQADATAALTQAALDKMEQLLRADAAPEFEIERRIGKGGMAVVYLATETMLARKVAIKVLPPELTFGHGIERFIREAKTAAALDHPHIIPIHRISSSGQIFWYAMKYLEGQSLDDLLKERGQLALADTVDILAQVADALDYAHEHQVIHRDIKPANIMLDGRRRVIVTDFGIAKALTEGTLTASGSVVGTPYYMSPEQAMGKHVTGASDQYSVGVMAYRMLSGHVPFEGDSAIDILHKHCRVPPPPLHELRTGLPAHVYKAIHKSIEKEAGKRFATVGRFIAGLRDETEELRDYAYIVSRGSATQVPEISRISTEVIQTPPTLRRVARSPQRPAIRLAAAAVVVAAGALGWWLLAGRGGGAAAPDAGGASPQATASTGNDGPEPVAAAATGEVAIAGLPTGGTVLVDGTPRQPPLTLEAGQYRVEMRAPDYQPDVRSVDVVAGQRLELTFSGTPIPAVSLPPSPAELRVTGLPPGGRVLVNGSARQPPVSLAPGRYRIEMTAPEHRADTRVVDLAQGQRLALEFRGEPVAPEQAPAPQPPPAGPATRELRIRVLPPANVTIDGQGFGERSGLVQTVRAGVSHRLVFSQTGYVTLDTLLTVPVADGPLIVRIQLKEEGS